MKTILITGAGGFIGGNLAESYLKKGDIVYGVDIFLEAMERLDCYQNFHPIQVKKDSFDELLKLHLPPFDHVFHLGWAGKLGGADLNNYAMQLGNIEMTKNLLDTLLKIGIHQFIFCGSISHYKYRNDVLYDVHSDIYGLAKKFSADLAMQVLCQKKIPCNTVLLANTYGVGDRSQKAVNTMIRKFLNNEKLTLIEADTPNDWVYITDTIRGLSAVAEKGRPYATYYIGHRRIPMFKDNLEAMKKALHSNMELKFGTYHDVTYADYSKVDLEALYRDTGFECSCDEVESLRNTANWLLKSEKGERK